MQYPSPSGSPATRTYEVSATAAATLMRSVFVWMAAALGLTGLMAYVMASGGTAFALMQNRLLFFGLVIAEFILVLVLARRIMRMSFLTATLCFIAYSVLNGLVLSPIFLVYTSTSIATTFFISAGMFGTMALVGYTTKADLSKYGTILSMALVGLLIAIVVNMFLNNSTFDYIISGIGVLLFTGLTAYDVNKIKQMLGQFDSVGETSKKVALIGSLSLYLDFINLFLFLLRFVGGRD